MADTIGIVIDKPVTAEEVMQQMSDAGITSLEELAASLSNESQELGQDDVAASWVIKVWKLEN